MNPNLAAALIVKNEAHIIERCIQSLLHGHIDTLVMSDTGSSDGTQELLHSVGVHVREDAWQDFAWNRNQVLKDSRLIGKYVLCGIDADEELVVPAGFEWPELTLDGYFLEVVNDSLRYPRLAIIRHDQRWEWRGVLHEALVPLISNPTTGTIKGPYILVHHDGARALNKETQKNDLEVLFAAMKREPDNARYMFYYAQTLKDLGRTVEAKNAYTQRVRMPGWLPETAYAQYMVGVMTERMGNSPILEYILAYNLDRTRAEPLHAMARYFRTHGNDGMAAILAKAASELLIPAGGLFVEHEVYEWRALDEFVTTAFYIPHLFNEGRLAAWELLQRQFPESERARIENNCAFYDVKGSP